MSDMFCSLKCYIAHSSGEGKGRQTRKTLISRSLSKLRQICARILCEIGLSPPWVSDQYPAPPLSSVSSPLASVFPDWWLKARGWVGGGVSSSLLLFVIITESKRVLPYSRNEKAFLPVHFHSQIPFFNLNLGYCYLRPN